MSEPANTFDGWYSLHDFRTVNWPAWKRLSEEERKEAVNEFIAILNKMKETEEKKEGSHVLYSVVGQKADLLLMTLRPTMKELNEIENELNKTRLAEFLTPAYSYVSVVELSNYLPAGVDPLKDPEFVARLYPILPKTEYICFYPMNKRRLLSDNWYMLPMEERRKLMHSHGMIGRKYAGKVKQIITGSVGFDDWEWGVTLFSDDALQFKKLVYEMRFDEVSARFGEFGSFFVGHLLKPEDLDKFFAV